MKCNHKKPFFVASLMLNLSYTCIAFKTKLTVELTFSNLTVFQIVVLTIFGISLLIQLFYYLFIYLKPAIYKSSASNISDKHFPPISVIICARNEHENLQEFLPKVLEQDYPSYEVIIVNDCSEDDTLSLLGILEQKYTHLRHTTIEPDRKFMHGKKLAVTIGIKSAKNEILVFTDADCCPESNQWLKNIATTYNPETDIVLGYGGYYQQPGFVDKLVRYETLFVAMQFLGFALCRKPYMGVGRNLSYKKSLFFSQKGFSNHYKLFSGDDDLFVNEHSTKTNTKVLINPESHTRSVAPSNFIAWSKQKRRHLTTWGWYKISDKIMLGLELLSRLTFYGSLVVGIWPGKLYILIGAGAMLRLIIQLLVFKLNMNKLNEKGFLLLTPVFDLIMPFVHFELTLLNIRNKRNTQWK